MDVFMWIYVERFFEMWLFI